MFWFYVQFWLPFFDQWAKVDIHCNSQCFVLVSYKTRQVSQPWGSNVLELGKMYCLWYLVVKIEGAPGALKLQIHLMMWICLIPSTSEGLKALYLRVALFSDIFGWLFVGTCLDISESISWGTFHRVSKFFGTRQSSGKSSSLCLLHLVLWLLVSLHGVHASASEFVVTGLFMDSCVWGRA